MNDKDRVAVCSRSFSANEELRREILSRYKHVKFNDDGLSLVGDTLANFLNGCDKVIIGLEKINEDLLKKVPSLKVVSKYGVGIDMIDLKSMKKHQVKLGWKGGVNRRAVSELALCFAISLLRHVPKASSEVKEGQWKQHKGNLLTGKTFGLIGFGNIGRDVANLLEPFDCKLLVYDINITKLEDAKLNIHFVDLTFLLKESDIVSLHLPLNEATSNIIDKNSFEMMKEHAILINLSRGGLVDEDALKNALQKNQIKAAAFDVFAEEPPLDVDLLTNENLLPTPHIGGLAKESILAMGYAAIDGLDENSLVR